MMPNDVWHRKTSIFSNPDSVVKEERDRRRILRIQQVRLQSKKIASQVVEKAKLLKKSEESKQKELKEKVLQDWKQKKLRDLQNELEHGLDFFGESHKAVDKELQDLKARKERQAENLQVAKERGSIAFSVDFAQREEARSQEEKLKNGRENLRSIENQRAKAVASLPPCIKPPVEPAPCKSEGTKVEVYDFSLPQHRRHVHFTTVPDDVVKKVDPKISLLSAREEASKEIAAREKKAEEQRRVKELTTWLGNAAETRKALEKEYKLIFGSLKHLEKQELATRPREALSVSDLNKLERKLRNKKKEELIKRNLVPAKMADDRKESASPQPMDFTEFPGTHFTPEEAGALGPTAHSLQALLDSLAGESRRRLEEVVGDDYYYCSDEDFATPPASPDDVSFSIESSSKLQVSSGAASVVSASSELSVTVKSGKHKKKKKKKNKRRHDTPDGHESVAEADKKQQSFLSTNSTQYMSPPDRLREDQIADYLANIEKEKEQLRRDMDAKKSGMQPIDVPYYVNKLLAMSRQSVDNLSVSEVTESSVEQHVPTKKSKSSSSSSSLSAAETSDDRDGLSKSNGQPSRVVDTSSFKEASTAYLSLHDLQSKDPVEARVHPNPGNKELVDLITAPAEPLVRPMEKLRLSTIEEADTTAVHSEKSYESQTMDLEAELLKRGLPLPKPSAADTPKAPTGDEYLRRLKQLTRFTESPLEEQGQPPNIFHSTPLTMETVSDASNGQFDSDNLTVSPILPSSEGGRNFP